MATGVMLAINLFFVGMWLLSAYSPYIHPAKHAILSCMGLAFPVFLVINLCFLLFWLLIRHFKLALLPVAALLLCSPQLITYLPVNARTSRLPQGSFKFLSYNIMAFDGASKKNGHNAILDYLKQSRADILCLQEYQVQKSETYLTQQDVEEALTDYPYHNIQVVGSQRGYSNRMACFSKYPILSARRVEYRSAYNGSVVYELLMEGDTVMVINNHLESNRLTKDDKVIYESMLTVPEAQKVKSGARLLIGKLAEASVIRSAQADSVAKIIQSSPHPYIIVCGDFNDTAISYTHRVIGQGLDDAFTHSGRGPGISFNQNHFYFRIDHILTSRNLQSYNCTVDDSIAESDHYPIWCYLSKKHP